MRLEKTMTRACIHTMVRVICQERATRLTGALARAHAKAQRTASTTRICARVKLISPFLFVSVSVLFSVFSWSWFLFPYFADVVDSVRAGAAPGGQSSHQPRHARDFLGTRRRHRQACAHRVSRAALQRQRLRVRTVTHLFSLSLVMTEYFTNCMIDYLCNATATKLAHVRVLCSAQTGAAVPPERSATPLSCASPLHIFQLL